MSKVRILQTRVQSLHTFPRQHRHYRYVKGKNNTNKGLEFTHISITTQTLLIGQGKFTRTCLIRHTKGPGKCVRFYRMSEYSGFTFSLQKFAQINYVCLIM